LKLQYWGKKGKEKVVKSFPGFIKVKKRIFVVQAVGPQGLMHARQVPYP
jgi:hypothetical protein